MINVDNKIRNIYYMLCYAFYGDKLNEKDETILGSEAFENIYNLFSVLLILLLKKQVKKGLYKDYNENKDDSNIIRGKINFNETISSNILAKGKVICEFDEYNTNCLLNSVIKTTIFYLLKSNKIGKNTKNELRKLSIYFVDIPLLSSTKNIPWGSIRFNRNNISYKYVVDMCRLILNGLIVASDNGKYKFKEFLDDTKVSKIYEHFVKAYYKKHYPELKAKSEKLTLTKNSMEFVTIMMTDITLEYNQKKLIIDTKFYSKILKNNYFNSQCKTFSNNNIYQIYTYVDSVDPYKSGNVCGMLLYAQTVDEPAFNSVIPMSNHKIIIKTLDMNESWENIKQCLNNIADDLKSWKF